MVCNAKLLCAAVALSSSMVLATDLTSYSVGNSLTEDMYKTLGGIMSARGVNWSSGFEMRSSTSLTQLYTVPSDFTYTVDTSGKTVRSPTTPGFTWDVALPHNNWNVATFQPYYGNAQYTSTLATDTAAVNGLITSTHSAGANADTRFYVYAPWSRVNFAKRDSSGFDSGWIAPTPRQQTENTTLSRAYFSDLLSSVRQSNPNVHVIPAGEVLYQLDLRMQHGEIPGFTTVAQLHRDDVHLNALGKHIAACTVFSTLTSQSPVGLAYLPGPTDPVVSDVALERMQQTVWNVVTSDPTVTGVTTPTTSR